MHSKIALVFVFVIAVGLVGSASAHKSEVVGDYKIEVGWKNEPPVVGMDNEITLTVTTATAFDKAEAEKEDQAMEGMDMGGDSHDTNMTDHSIEGMNTSDSNMTGHSIEGMNASDSNMTGHSIEGMNASDSNMTGHDEMAAGHDEMETMSDHNMGNAISTGILKGFTADIMIGDSDTPLNLVEDSKYPGVYIAEFTPTATGFPMVHISGILNEEAVDITFHPEQVESLSTLSPLKQMANGINPDDVQCKEGFDLYMKSNGGHAFCLHPSSAEKLLLRGVITHF